MNYAINEGNFLAELKHSEIIPLFKKDETFLYFFENLPWDFSFFLLYPWKFQTKQSSTPGYSTKLC